VRAPRSSRSGVARQSHPIPTNRAGWHLWALAESNPRERVARWQQVSQRFPEDQLAKANLADNAASLAGAEHDYQAVDLAIDTYEELLATAEHPDQRSALEKAIKTLKGWKFLSASASWRALSYGSPVRVGDRYPLRRYARSRGAPNNAPSLCSVAGLLWSLTLQAPTRTPVASCRDL